MVTTNVKITKDKTFNNAIMVQKNNVDKINPNTNTSQGKTLREKVNIIDTSKTPKTSQTSKTLKTPKIKKVTFNNHDSFDDQSNNKSSDIDHDYLNNLECIKNYHKNAKLKKPSDDVSESEHDPEHSDYSSDDSDDDSDLSSGSNDEDDSYDTHSCDTSDSSRIMKHSSLIKKPLVKNPDKNHISNFDATSELMSMFNFRTSASSVIRSDVMLFAIKNINRKNTIMTLAQFLPISIADKVEQGILEFSMIHISNENEDVVHFLPSTYQTITNDICVNLDVNNARINNQTLAPSLIDGGLDPQLVAFMTPQQIHPARWFKLLEKKKIAEEADDNKKVTDIYKCKRCSSSRFTTHQMQTRGADEPMTIFATCLVCYNTFTTQ